jgi:transketolase
MNKIPNRQAICDVLVEKANTDKDIVVLCSDSRGSASLTNFSKAHPEQFVETGIAEQNLVSIAAGLAKCGKKSYVASPACFLSTRSMEQAKVDVAYSNTNVKLIGISGGVSYGALGMTHHSAQDIAAMGSIPNMRVYIPSDRIQTKALFENLLNDEKPAYIRVGRNPVEDVYEEGSLPFEFNKATVVHEGTDITIIACGEMVKSAQQAAVALKANGISTRVLDMYCVKPIDKEAVEKAARETKAIITIEEHSYIGGLGAMVSQIVSGTSPKKVINLALPDEPVVTGVSKQIFDYYGLNENGLVKAAMELINDAK